MVAQADEWAGECPCYVTSGPLAVEERGWVHATLCKCDQGGRTTLDLLVRKLLVGVHLLALLRLALPVQWASSLLALLLLVLPFQWMEVDLQALLLSVRCQRLVVGLLALILLAQVDQPSCRLARQVREG